MEVSELGCPGKFFGPRLSLGIRHLTLSLTVYPLHRRKQAFFLPPLLPLCLPNFGSILLRNPGKRDAQKFGKSHIIRDNITLREIPPQLPKVLSKPTGTEIHEPTNLHPRHRGKPLEKRVIDAHPRRQRVRIQPASEVVDERLADDDGVLCDVLFAEPGDVGGPFCGAVVHEFPALGTREFGFAAALVDHVEFLREERAGYVGFVAARVVVGEGVVEEDVFWVDDCVFCQGGHRPWLDDPEFGIYHQFNRRS